MSDRWDKLVKEQNEVFTFSMVKGQPAPPKIILPKFVADRIELFREDMENGLTFFGALQFILWGDDKYCSEEYQFGGVDLEKVKPTKEFEDWTNEWLLSGPRQQKIALALIYGYDIEGEEQNE
ncbi:MAG TPA: DUF1642 domain-containing protein [Ligilactobacillus acidipiscis]|uniref:DUF1642 domain-containing protein n=1 Tax=Ligilactobacillus acidipiscis TaxID=89059 RepID=A0A921F725_9LACO|nr:DUF1642 domain-containing protein [Ligilactobacillus acidipiscis]